MAIGSLLEQDQRLCPTSIKLVATNCINKYSRKLKKETISYSNEEFDQILD